MYLYRCVVFAVIATAAVGRKIGKVKDCGPAAVPGKPLCGPNEKSSKCKIICPPQTCQSLYALYRCKSNIPCEYGCDCIAGYLRNTNGTCIPSEHCSSGETTEPVCGPNEEYSDCKFVCPPQSCESIYTSYLCEDRPCEAGCNCIDGYLRDGENNCIPNDQCSSSPVDPVCGPNEKSSKCKIVCPPQTCESIYALYKCESNIPCESGCDCIAGYLRNTNGTCIPSEQCSSGEPTEPVCGPNEEYSDCKFVCPPQSCESIYTSYLCEDRPCEAGCNCIDGYLRDGENNCIPNDQCSSCEPTEPVCGPNEEYSDCKFVCPPQSCESIYTSYLCEDRPCEAGCNCIDGYLRDGENNCIPNDQCSSCPNQPTEPVCGPNEKYSDCKFVCPPQSCESSYTDYYCEKRPCEAGCNCIDDYLRDGDNNCIPSDQCPSPGDVTPEPCSSANSAEDIKSSTKSESSSQSTSSAKTSSSSSHSSSSSSSSSSSTFSTRNIRETKEPCSGDKPDCQPTCAEPNPTNCSVKEGECEDGYILSEKGGKCIRIEDCPKGCNGDLNAVAKSCPAACPSTCSRPNASPCKKKCEPLGCECAFGYLLDENGKCVSPDECPGGNPCGDNERFVACKGGCPTDYCPIDDSRAIVICETYPFSPCFSGCVCNLNHKRLSREDYRCIVSSDCPPVNCTRPNEEWNSCPSECLGEYCDSANSEPVTCNTLVLNCQPRCTCKKNYFRNETDICIPAEDCTS